MNKTNKTMLWCCCYWYGWKRNDAFCIGEGGRSTSLHFTCFSFSIRWINLLKNWYNSIEMNYCGKYESLELGFRIFRVTATHNEQYENKFGCLFISNILQYRTFIFKKCQTLRSLLQAESKFLSSIAVSKCFNTSSY